MTFHLLPVGLGELPPRFETHDPIRIEEEDRRVVSFQGSFQAVEDIVQHVREGSGPGSRVGQAVQCVQLGGTASGSSAWHAGQANPCVAGESNSHRRSAPLKPAAARARWLSTFFSAAGNSAEGLEGPSGAKD